MKSTLFQDHPLGDGPYTGTISGQASIMQREMDTLTPGGNVMGGRWVLRIGGEMKDFDKYRSDLAERNGIKLASIPETA